MESRSPLLLTVRALSSVIDSADVQTRGRSLRGADIPLGARIVMVSAAYDAMTEDRPYRRGLSARAACDELSRCSGTQFFPEVVEAFVSLHHSGKLWEDFTREELNLYVRR